MADLVFDGKKLNVPAGTNLVDAGAMAGISVPIFCYHKDLGAVGSCRVCAVTVTQGDKTRTVMGCMTEALDGMEVTTLDAYSVALRKNVLEWLMINHPHDCPICDEGGECQLQDLTIASGHAIRHYEGSKRTFLNQQLGEFIHHEMNRCITCYRCARFYQDYAGGRDFSATGSRDRVYFGRFEDGPFESAFSGNLVEMCPTGVFTDKLFRYKSRVWDLEIAPSICPHCSIGCNVLPGSRFRELQRVRVRENAAVNGAFLCDRGQFGHGYVMDPERPRSVRVHGEPVDWDQALGVAGGTLLELARQHGPESVALVASSRASLEAHHALRQLAQGPLAGARVAHFDDPDREARALAALAALRAAGAASLDQGDLAHCDVLVVAGTSLVDEAPLAALAARQVARRGGSLFVLSACERYLDDVATVLPIAPAELAATLTDVARGIGTPAADGPLAAVASALAAAQSPGLLIGSDLVDGATFEAAASLARALVGAGKAARFGCLFPGPNAFGAALMSSGPVLPDILSGLESGTIRGIVLVESETSSWSARARQALGSVELLAVLDYVAGPLVDSAHVLLPTTATYESNGAYVNRAGRLQTYAQARVPGLSVQQLIAHESFPREPRRTPPESDARPAWAVLEGLRDRGAGKPPARALDELRDDLERSAPVWRPLRNAAAGGEGVPLDLSSVTATAAAAGAIPPFERASGLALFRMDRTLGSEFLSRRSAAMQTMAGPPVAWLSPADARDLGDAERVTLDVGGATVELAARAQRGVAPGVVIVPREVEWSIAPRQGASVRVLAAEEARR